MSAMGEFSRYSNGQNVPSIYLQVFYLGSDFISKQWS